MVAGDAPASNWELSEYPTPILMENSDLGINIGQSGAWLFVQNEQLEVDQKAMGIEQKSATTPVAAPIYDLYGHKHPKAEKGRIYLQHGQRVIMK